MRRFFIGVSALLLAWSASGESREVTVAADGTGQFSSVQRAVDAAPSYSRQRFVIHIKPGIYKERVTVPPDKTFLTFRGDDAKTTVITFDVHPGPNPKGGRPLITFDTPTVFIQADDFTAENITFENSAGRQGQALALTILGDRGVFRNCRFLGYQDTLLAQAGRQYFDHCYIQGAVDFIFGGSAAFFDHCEIHVTANGYITAANTPEDQKYGYVFSHCKITGEPGALTYLGRPWRPYAETVFLDTEMPVNVRPAGWNNWNDPAKEKTARYAEYGSTGPGASASARVSWAKPLSDAEAKTYTIENVLGSEDGWNPRTGSVQRAVKIETERSLKPAELPTGSVLLALTGGDPPRLAYSSDGYRWTMAGPAPQGFVLRGPDGTFHRVWSSGARGDRSFVYSSSKDLKQWAEPRRIEIMAGQPALNVIDPRLYWDSDARQFIVTWASTMDKNAIQAFQEEVDNNPRIFYATTRDFETFSEPALLFDPNYSVKDALILKDGARFVLLHNDNATPVHDLRVAFGPTPLGPWGPSRDAFTQVGIEQPAAIQIGGEWWIYSTDTRTGKGGLLRTRDFWTFTEAPDTAIPGGITSLMLGQTTYNSVK